MKRITAVRIEKYGDHRLVSWYSARPKNRRLEGHILCAHGGNEEIYARLKEIEAALAEEDED